MVHIGKKRISVPTGRHINLIECFLNHAGRVVPYEILSAAMKWRGTEEGFKHCLRQYILQLRMILRNEKVHAHFAVAGGIGYALCEPARD
jgi:DNA-binding response OmpR family regulator